MPLFNRMTLDDAFALLLTGKIIAKEFKTASKKINRLKDNDWRLWFGRFLLFVRSDAENHRYTDAYICLEAAEELLLKANDEAEFEKFFNLINNESLFLNFKFYYEASGLASLALLLARCYQNGWGVAQNIQKAYKYAEIAAKGRATEPIYLPAKELLNSLSLELSKNKQ